MDNKYVIEREKDYVVVCILPNKDDKKFSFINLTKGHICSCKFDSIKDAISDMDRLISEGKIIRYIKII